MFHLPRPQTFSDGRSALKDWAAIGFGLFCGLYAIVSTVLFAWLVIKFPTHQTLTISVLAGSSVFAWVGCLSTLWATTGRDYSLTANRGGITLSTSDGQAAAQKPVPPTPNVPEGPHVE